MSGDGPTSFDTFEEFAEFCDFTATHMAEDYKTIIRRTLLGTEPELLELAANGSVEAKLMIDEDILRAMMSNDG